jgi:hypothetical protein
MFKIFFTNSSVADPDTGSGLRCLFDPWILDGQKVRIRIRDPWPTVELRNHSFWLKYLKYLIRIRDSWWKKFGFGIPDGKKSDPAIKIRIRKTGKFI